MNFSICLSIKIIIFIGLFSSLKTALANQRSIFLNGIDISSAKHQILENVTVRIDGQGQIFIEAPHYEVNEESTYIPLSTWNREEGDLPRHQTGGPIPASRRAIGETKSQPGLNGNTREVPQVLTPKAGSKQKEGDEQVTGQLSKNTNTNPGDNPTPPATGSAPGSQQKAQPRGN